jgi:hypothetical protein
VRGTVREDDGGLAGRAYGASMRATPLLAALALTGATAALAAPAQAAGGYKVKVTCTVPSHQQERQLAPNSCFNYLPDGTQTFTAKVTNGSGKAVVGAVVQWSDSASNAAFRSGNNPCVTGRNGTCSDEIVVTRPKASQKITVTATSNGASGTGYLSFRSSGR